MKRLFSNFVIIIVVASMLSACSEGRSTQLANELEFSLEGINSITISYDEEPIIFFESDSSTLIIREYMTKNRSSYHAIVNKQSESIQVSEGGKPFVKKSFYRHVEVYLPLSYHQNSTVTSSSGKIDFSDTFFDLSFLRVDTTSGNVITDDVSAREIKLTLTSGILETGKLSANSIHIESTSSRIKCKELDGNVTYTTTSGDLEVQSAIGSGNYRTNNSGMLNITYTEVTGDLFFFNKNDDITIILPKDLQFRFEATTKNGMITTDFQQALTVEEQITKGTIGVNPTVTVTVETKNGNIEVLQ